MESQRKFINLFDEIQQLKSIIRMRLGVDITKSTRTREYVDARIIYAKILRERGYTLKRIGESLNREHTIIVHYLKIADTLVMQDDNFYMNLVSCRNKFNLETGGSEELQLEEMKTSVKRLTRENDFLIRERDTTKKIIDKYDRFSVLIDYLDKFIPSGDESFITKKIMRAIN